MQRDLLLLREMIDAAEQARSLTTATEQLGDFVKQLHTVVLALEADR